MGNLSSPGCSSVNVIGLFNLLPHTKKSHCHRKYNPFRIYDDVTIDNLLPHMQKPLGLHHIRTKLYSVPLSRLRQLQTEALNRRITEQDTPEYKLIGVVLDIGQYRIFKSTQTGPSEKETRSFLKIQFKNIGLDAINLRNILQEV